MLTRLALVLLMTPQFLPRTVEDPSGRYYAVKQVGKDPYGYQSLDFTLTPKATSVKVVWARRDQEAERERRELTLDDLKLDANGLSGTVKGERPPNVPAKWKGKFVTKTPPPNAKGPTEPGLLIDGDWFFSLMERE